MTQTKYVQNFSARVSPKYFILTIYELKQLFFRSSKVIGRFTDKQFNCQL